MAKKIAFTFPSPEAKLVSLVGEFNHWDRDANPMKKDRRGVWKTVLSLTPGKYEYRFLADGVWENDPSCPGCVVNEFGSLNCVKIVD
jgi:1,4-alpha-glucan branching enzyme